MVLPNNSVEVGLPLRLPSIILIHRWRTGKRAFTGKWACERKISSGTFFSWSPLKILRRFAERTFSLLNCFLYVFSSCNDQLLMPNPPGNSLGFNPNQKEIGPALTPLIDEVDQDQGLLEGEINQLIQTSKSLAGSLSSPDPNHTDQDVEEPQTVDRSILKQQHHHPTENAPGSSMMISGILIFISSSLLWIIGIPLILFDLDSFGDTINDANDYVDPTKSSVSGWLKWLLIKILDDQHYKYFLPLQITFGLVFVIINWGGLKIFRHSWETFEIQSFFDQAKHLICM